MTLGEYDSRLDDVRQTRQQDMSRPENVSITRKSCVAFLNVRHVPGECASSAWRMCVKCLEKVRKIQSTRVIETHVECASEYASLRRMKNARQTRVECASSA